MSNASRNDITGKPIFNKSEGVGATLKYEEGYDRIWGSKPDSANEIVPNDADTIELTPPPP